MCSGIERASIHGFNAKQTLMENLFQLDFNHSSFSIEPVGCIVPSSYLYNGMEIGVPLAILSIVSAILFGRFIKPLVPCLGLPFLLLAAYLAYYVSGYIKNNTKWHQDFQMTGSDWQAIVAQFGFNAVLFIIIPFATVVFLRKLISIWFIEFERSCL